MVTLPFEALSGGLLRRRNCPSDLLKAGADLRERQGPRVLWDGALAGFGVAVFPSGKKVYLCQYRQNGRSRRANIHAPARCDEAQAANPGKLRDIAGINVLAEFCWCQFFLCHYICSRWQPNDQTTNLAKKKPSRSEGTLKRMLSTPHKPHSEMKLGKSLKSPAKERPASKGRVRKGKSRT
jgi:hypothetical protein